MVMESSADAWHPGPYTNLNTILEHVILQYVRAFNQKTWNSEYSSVTCNTQIKTPYLLYLTIHNRIRTPTNVMDLMKRKVNMLWMWHYSICWFKENFALSIRLLKFQMNEVSTWYCEGNENPDIMPDFEKFFLTQKATSEGTCAIFKEEVAISGKTLNSIRN